MKEIHHQGWKRFALLEATDKRGRPRYFDWREDYTERDLKRLRKDQERLEPESEWLFTLIIMDGLDSPKTPENAPFKLKDGEWVKMW